MRDFFESAGPPTWWPPFIAATATILVGAAALTIALHQLNNQRRIAKRRNTIDLIVKFETDSFYQSAFSTFRRLARGEIGPTDFIGATSDEQRATRDSINGFFNYCELMALSLRRGAIDQEIFYQWCATPYVQIWNYSVTTVDLLRDGPSGRNPRSFATFEIVARHFATRLKTEGIQVGFVSPLIINQQPLMIRESTP